MFNKIYLYPESEVISMKHYFGQTSNFSLSFFGPVHLLLILGTILAIFGIYKYRDKLKKYKIVKTIIPIILFSNMVIYIAGAMLAGIYDIKIHLPIHYCYITGFAFMYMLIKDKKNWFNMLYYAIFFCTITVIIFQDPNITYDRYEFLLLVISHHFLLLSSFYTLYVLDYPVNKKGYKPFLIYTLIVYLVVFGLNRILGTDYIFNDSFPLFIYDCFPFIKMFPPIVWLFLLSIPLLICAYMPVRYKNRNVN
ncbi:MAG: YwaF family protein [Bacilli bacterium]|nr:YwaF family protein [Bacilli bacterium]